MDEGKQDLEFSKEPPEVAAMRQQIVGLDRRLQEHYSGIWSDDEPADPAQREETIRQEFERYQELTGFPINSKKNDYTLGEATYKKNMELRGSFPITEDRKNKAVIDGLLKDEKVSIREKLSKLGAPVNPPPARVLATAGRR